MRTEPSRPGEPQAHAHASFKLKLRRAKAQGQTSKKLIPMRFLSSSLGKRKLKPLLCTVCYCIVLKDEDQAYRKIRLRAEDVQGKNVLTNFWGMDFTTDKLRSLVRKWQTLIEAHVDLKTTDSYTLGMFYIGFAKKLANQPCKEIMMDFFYSPGRRPEQIKFKSDLWMPSANHGWKSSEITFAVDENA
ncbi:hypothetical protein POM88_037529 [Heracleum sosnowskyi]|uniref:40S ribosomal protein S3a n=1 Tax=Heracleum sosnowskyi TaxID=360622 RepID=A0AAD8HQA4_9APIA|nr:hypothetical protein POM88_037529 [Heracleum sosnowskyi]